MGLGNTGNDWGVVGLQTWTSLGLIYRTPKDIATGVEIVMARNVGLGGRKQYKDMSTPVLNALRRDEGDFENHSGDLFWFAAQVGNEGRWNIKRDAKIWEETIGTTFPGYSGQMYFFGILITVEDAGNITYGYLGKAAEISDNALQTGSAVNHAAGHGFNDWGNEAADWGMIAAGISLYKQVH